MIHHNELKLKEREPGLVRNLLLVYGVSVLDFSFSLLVNILIPLIASKADFANYRKLILYVSYAGLLHFGLLSGMYLYVVGKTKQELDWNLLATIKFLLFALQMIILPALLVFLWSTKPQGVDIWILTLSIVCCGMANFATFYNYLFQGINSFSVFFLVNASVKALSILLILYVVLIRAVTTAGLVLVFIVPLALTVMLYEFVWRFYAKGAIRQLSVVQLDRDIIGLWRRGLVLYSANVCISFLFTIDNLSVSLLFGPTEFANYSFAYGLTTVLYYAIDGLTAVVVPYLARAMRLANPQDASRQVYLAVAWLVPITFWFSALLVNSYFPKYLESIPLLLFFSASLPFNILVRSRVVAVATATGLEGFLLRFAIAGLGLTAVSVAAAYFLFRSVYSVALFWSFALVVAGTVGLYSMRRTLGGFANSGSHLTRNALGATVLYILCVAVGGLDLRAAILYALGACVALGINWRHMRAANRQTSTLAN